MIVTVSACEVALTGPICAHLWSGWELSDFSKDFGEAIGKAIEAPTRMTVAQSSAEHFQSVLCDEQRIDDTIQALTRRREWRLRRVNLANCSGLP
jgi:hypothetical protein